MQGVDIYLRLALVTRAAQVAVKGANGVMRMLNSQIHLWSKGVAESGDGVLGMDKKRASPLDAVGACVHLETALIVSNCRCHSGPVGVLESLEGNAKGLGMRADREQAPSKTLRERGTPRCDIARLKVVVHAAVYEDLGAITQVLVYRPVLVSATVGNNLAEMGNAVQIPVYAPNDLICSLQHGGGFTDFDPLGR